MNSVCAFKIGAAEKTNALSQHRLNICWLVWFPGRTRLHTMHFDHRLWGFTWNVRGRIYFAVLIGLLATGLGVARLAMLGWLIALVFAGRSAGELLLFFIATGIVMILRGAFEHWRTMVAHKTAAVVQKELRLRLYHQVVALGPGYTGRQRSGELVLSLGDGVEQLETYFG